MGNLRSPEGLLETIPFPLCVGIRFIIIDWQCAVTTLISPAAVRRALFVAIVSWKGALKKESGKQKQKHEHAHACKHNL